MATQKTAGDIYLHAIRNQAARVLSLLDREALSPTFGCFDRTYWAWKVTDFPVARFQEGLCLLCFLYTTQFESDVYYGNEKLRRWITGGFDFWTRIQRPGGYFDEAYPYEHSLAATAFSTFYMAEAWDSLATTPSCRPRRTVAKAPPAPAGKLFSMQ